MSAVWSAGRRGSIRASPENFPEIATWQAAVGMAVSPRRAHSEGVGLAVREVVVTDLRALMVPLSVSCLLLLPFSCARVRRVPGQRALTAPT